MLHLSEQWVRGMVPPTYREMVRDLGLSIEAIKRALADLVSRGLIAVEPRKARAVTVLIPVLPLPPGTRLPCHAGEETP